LKHALTFRAAHESPRVVHYVVEEGTPLTRQLVRGLSRLSHRETGVVLPLNDISPTTLHEVGGQFLSQSPAPMALRHVGKRLKLLVQQPQKITKGCFVTGVRSGCQEHKMPLGLTFRDSSQQVITLVTGARVSLNACVSLVNDYKFRTRSQEIVPALVGLDVVE